jgi:hypothetical protein
MKLRVKYTHKEKVDLSLVKDVKNIKIVLLAILNLRKKMYNNLHRYGKCSVLTSQTSKPILFSKQT